jgi:hemerythrin-like domain-containing protein
MRDRCERLRRLAGDLLAANRDPGLGRRAAALRREIDSMMPGHHRQEEALLFPALAEAVPGSDPVCLRELTQFLAAEHRALEELWQRVRHLLEAVESGVPIADLEALRAFADGYLQHIQREEQELFPMVERLLTEDEFARIWQELHPAGGN